jgi:hypothetical protein
MLSTPSSGPARLAPPLHLNLLAPCTRTCSTLSLCHPPKGGAVLSDRSLVPSRDHVQRHVSALACRSITPPRSSPLGSPSCSCSAPLLVSAEAGPPWSVPLVAPRSAMRRRVGSGDPRCIAARSIASRSRAASLPLVGSRSIGSGFGMPSLSRASSKGPHLSIRREVALSGGCYSK